MDSSYSQMLKDSTGHITVSSDSWMTAIIIIQLPRCLTLGHLQPQLPEGQILVSIVYTYNKADERRRGVVSLFCQCLDEFSQGVVSNLTRASYLFFSMTKALKSTLLSTGWSKENGLENELNMLRAFITFELK